MKTQIFSFITLILLLSCFVSGFSQTATVYVDSASSCSINCNGSTWNTAYPKLQDALAVLNAGDTLFIAKGTYYPDEGLTMSSFNNNSDTSFVIPSGVKIYGGFSPVNGIDSLHEQDWLAYPTILSGEIQQDNIESNNSYHVLMTLNINSPIHASGLIIEHGNANNTTVYGSPKSQGGGWFHDNYSSNSSILKLSNCIFRNNKAAYVGAGLSSPNGNIQIYHCTFDQNISSNKGGAFYLEDGSSYIVNSAFSRNQAYKGGAIYNSSGTITVVSCSFGMNYGNYNGTSIYNSMIMNIYNSIIYDNNPNYLTIYANQVTNIKHCVISNCYNSNGNWNTYVGTNQGNNYDFDPGFVDASNGNLRLSTCPLSDARDKADSTLNPNWLQVDLDGNPRIAHNAMDIGAYEIDHGFRIDSVEILNHATCLIFGKAKIHYSTYGNSHSFLWQNGKTEQINDSLKWGYHQLIAYDTVTACYDTSDVTIKIYHNSHGIYVNSAANGENTGCSWVNAFNYLQDAFLISDPGDTIFIAEGSYYPDDGYFVNANDRDTSFVIPGGVVIYGGFSPANGVDMLNEQNPHLYKSILSGNIQQDNSDNNNSIHVVSVYNSWQKISVNGIYIQDGNANGSNEESYGGGVYFKNGDANFTNCVFRYNKSNYRGAGFYINSWSKADLVINNSTFYMNKCGMYGGGMAAFINPSCTDIVRINNCLFDENQGDQGGSITFSGGNPKLENCIITNSNYLQTGIYGSAIQLLGTSAKIKNCDITNNWGYNGGAIYSNNSDFVLENCNVNNNISNQAGGAIQIIQNNGIQNKILNCEFHNNECTGSVGGAIMIDKGKAAIDRCSFRNNKSSNSGGAIYLDYIFTANSVSITNSEFYNNQTTQGKGGAIYSYDSWAKVFNCSFANNSALGAGQAIYNSNSHGLFDFKLTNSIIWSNSSSTQNHISNPLYQYKIKIKNCIVKNSGGSGTSWVSSYGIDSGGNIDANPGFYNLNQGDLRIHACPKSIAINAGTNSSLLSPYNLDMAGNNRIFNNDTVDIGAYESSYASNFIVSDTTIHVCNGDSFYIANQYITNDSIINDTVYNSASCDSIFRFAILFNNPITTNIFPTVCKSYTSPSGNYTWTASGLYTDTLVSMGACDSIININLTILQVYTGITIDTNTLHVVNSADSYQWLDCNNNMSPLLGDTLQYLTITASGNFAVEVNSFGCVDTSMCIYVAYSGFEQFKIGDKILIYPNPTNDILNIEFSKLQEDIRIRIFSLQGALLFEDFVKNVAKHKINPQLVSGIYFLEIVSENKRSMHRVIIH